MEHLPDEELIARCACGDRRAMDEIVSRYHGKLLDFAFRHLHDREAAADIAQSAFIRVFESADSFRQKASFRTWLYTIAMNLIRDHCRRRRVRPEMPYSEIEEAASGDLPAGRRWYGPEKGSPEAAAIDRIAASSVWEQVDELPESHKAAITLRFRHGLTYDEIAEVMGAPSGTVKSWIHYGLKSLRQSLQPLNCEV